MFNEVYCSNSNNKKLLINDKKLAFEVTQKTTNTFKQCDSKYASDQVIIDACMTNNLNLIEEYLISKYNVNGFLKSGWTLLLYAASYSQPNVIKYLLNSGANPNLHYEGYTPLMALCSSNRGSPEIRITCLKLLLEAKADVNAANKIRETPLMIACKMQETDFILELLKNNVLINFADSEQRTAIFYAITNNRYEITKILIENGADITLTNYRGLTPYDIAITKGYEKFIPLLKVNIENELDSIQVKTISSWMDMFATMNNGDANYVNSDVENILYGMRLESYTSCFYGISLKRFLNLKEDDLIKLGVDISVHRKRFADELFRFHKHEWSDNLIKIDKSQQFSTYKTVIVLGNINKQLSVISSSMHYSKTCIDYIEANTKLDYRSSNKEDLMEEIKNIEETILNIKQTTIKIKILSKIIREENSNLSLPIYIGRKIKKNDKKWITMTFIVITSIWLFRVQNIRTVWINKNILSGNWSNIFNISLFNILFNKFHRICSLLQKNFQIF